MRKTTLSKGDIEFANPVEKDKKCESISSSLDTDSEEDFVDELPNQGPAG